MQTLLNNGCTLLCIEGAAKTMLHFKVKYSALTRRHPVNFNRSVNNDLYNDKKYKLETILW